MPDPRLLNIAIPVFNRPELTRITLEAIRGMRSPIPFVITVVDNGSDKDTEELLRRFKALGGIDTLLRLDSNLGVSCAANLGWRAVDSDLYMKLDNDIKMLDPDWLRIVFERWRAVEPVSTIAACWEERLFADGELRGTPAGPLSLCPTNLAGGAILVPKAVSDRLGMWNEDYGLYGADDGDYGLRMRAAGLPQYYYPSNGLFFHQDDDAAVTYAARGINKREQLNAVFGDEQTSWGLFCLNALLYTLQIRSLRVPLKYELQSVDADGRVRIRVSRRYREFRKGLLLCRELLRAMCPDGEMTACISKNAVARLRRILVDHGDNPL